MAIKGRGLTNIIRMANYIQTMVDRIDEIFRRVSDLKQFRDEVVKLVEEALRESFSNGLKLGARKERAVMNGGTRTTYRKGWKATNGKDESAA